MNKDVKCFNLLMYNYLNKDKKHNIKLYIINISMCILVLTD